MPRRILTSIPTPTQDRRLHHATVQVTEKRTAIRLRHVPYKGERRRLLPWQKPCKRGHGLSERSLRPVQGGGFVLWPSPL